jgi:hypothetical protein
MDFRDAAGMARDGFAARNPLVFEMMARKMRLETR